MLKKEAPQKWWFFSGPYEVPAQILKAKDLAYLAFDLRIGIVYVDSLLNLDLWRSTWVS